MDAKTQHELSQQIAAALAMAGYEVPRIGVSQVLDLITFLIKDAVIEAINELEGDE